MPTVPTMPFSSRDKPGHARGSELKPKVYFVWVHTYTFALKIFWTEVWAQVCRCQMWNQKRTKTATSFCPVQCSSELHYSLFGTCCTSHHQSRPGFSNLAQSLSRGLLVVPACSVERHEPKLCLILLIKSQSLVTPCIFNISQNLNG